MLIFQLKPPFENQHGYIGSTPTCTHDLITWAHPSSTIHINTLSEQLNDVILSSIFCCLYKLCLHGWNNLQLTMIRTVQSNNSTSLLTDVCNQIGGDRKYTFLSFEVRIRQKIRSYMKLAKCIEPMCWLGGMRYAIYMLLIGVEGVYA